MNAAHLIDALKRKTGTGSDQALRRVLGLSPVTLNGWRTRRRLTPRMLAEQICRGRVSGADVISTLTTHLRASSLRGLSRQLGITEQAVQNWKNRPVVTARQVAGLVKIASASAERHFHTSALRPLVEFFPITKCPSKQRAKFELFVTKTPKGKPHAYLTGLQTELKNHHGIYIFFDSRGRAIYVGKARKQYLWSEITSAFNRDRGSVQKIKKVWHPVRNQAYQTSNEKIRQILDIEVPLYELAAYFSAYDVTDVLIEDLEALLVRSFANDVLNKRMEQFGSHRVNT